MGLFTLIISLLAGSIVIIIISGSRLLFLLFLGSGSFLAREKKVGCIYGVLSTNSIIINKNRQLKG